MTKLIQPTEPHLRPMSGFDARCRARKAELDEDAYLDQNGEAIEPCTLEQIDLALSIIQTHWPENDPDTRNTLHQFHRLRKDMAENLECGTDINCNSVTWGAMESYNQFLKNHPNLVQDAGPTELSTIVTRWEGEKGAGHITFVDNGDAYCIADYKMPKGIRGKHGVEILSRDCKPSEIKSAFREMRNIQQAQIQQALAQQRRAQQAGI